MTIAALGCAALDVSSAKPARAFVPPPYTNSEPSIEGTFSVEGTEPGGSPEPSGTGTIVRLGGARYSLTEAVGSSTTEAICLRRGAILACGWGRPFVDRGIALYTGNVLLDGVWTEEATKGIGHERLAGGDVKNGGTWTIVEGVDATGGKYDGTVTTSVGGLVQEWVWSMRGQHWFGVGVEFAGVIAVGYNLSRTCGVVVYEIRASGGELEGVWVDPGRPNALGTEILRRK